MGPCTASSCCCQVPECVMGPCTASHAAVSIATLCHVPLSGLLTLLVVSIFVIGRAVWPPIAAASTATCGYHNSGFGPVTAQMSEVCGDSKIDGLICMSY
ncbi:unnamed protein product [Staurois parvus]|uniref:Uncharacterized protein n=1 Tax=Staurois parvus TaxID=386267 RepID=A0ABN9BD67_9NEOB|nr:unnamed protein product [Staurois parvus]